MEEPVIVKPTDQKHFMVFEKLDEQQIQAEIQGAFVNDMVYQSKDAVSLSYAGVKELTRFMVKHGYDVALDPVEVEETDNEFRARCKVTYTTPTGNTLSMYGYTRQLKQFSNGKEDEFAYQKVTSKAQRNAARAIIPKKAATRMLELFLKQGKVKTVKSNEVNDSDGYEEIEPETEKVVSTTEKVVSTIESPQPTKSDLPHVVKWTIKGKQFAIPRSDSAYKNLIMNKKIPDLTKNGVKFKEEVANDHVVSIYTSDMSTKDYDAFASALTWAISRDSKCKENDVEIIVEDTNPQE